jgi:hypothetical protein
MSPEERQQRKREATRRWKAKNHFLVKKQNERRRERIRAGLALLRGQRHPSGDNRQPNGCPEKGIKPLGELHYGPIEGVDVMPEMGPNMKGGIPFTGGGHEDTDANRGRDARAGGLDRAGISGDVDRDQASDPADWGERRARFGQLKARFGNLKPPGVAVELVV